MAALTTPTPQEAAVTQALAAVPVPEGIHFKELSFAEDYSGDPAVFIAYTIDSVEKPQEERALELAFLRRSVIRSVWALGLNVFPYVRFIPGT
jgi:hypothetical protein